jgi:hypothetical protein
MIPVSILPMSEKPNQERTETLKACSVAEDALRRPFSQDSARPLGKGYSEIMHMVLSYASAEKTAGNPTLQHSLDRFRTLPALRRHLAGLAEKPLCLIQGYSTPGTAGALGQFINDHIGSLPRIALRFAPSLRRARY